jgi:hypothetical protein
VDSALQQLAAVQQHLAELNAEAKQLVDKRHGDVLLGAKPEGRSAYKKAYDDLQRQIADLSAMRKAQTHMLIGRQKIFRCQR